MHDEPISVLFVDDEAAVLRSIARSLAHAAIDVLTANCAGEALSILDLRHIDVLVTDVDMPDMNGLELALIARRDHPDTLRMLLTGHATLDKAMHAINEGEVLRFFTKPFEPVIFLEEIEALEGRIRQMRAQREELSRDQQRHELEEWLTVRYPGALHVQRTDDGEVIVDLLAVLADIDEDRLPSQARNLVRREA
jgi:DNA-binding NtrC family response regulator